MALTNCDECGKDLSEYATLCPHCGAPAEIALQTFRRELEEKRLEQERLEQERLEQERLEQERLEQERLEQKRLEQESWAQSRLDTIREKLEEEEMPVISILEDLESLKRVVKIPGEEPMKRVEEQIDSLLTELADRTALETYLDDENLEIVDRSETLERYKQEEKERIERFINKVFADHPDAELVVRGKLKKTDGQNITAQDLDSLNLSSYNFSEKETLEHIQHALDLERSLASLRLGIECDTVNGGDLVEAVDANRIIRELEEQFDVVISSVHLDEPIKRIGLYRVDVNVHPYLSCRLRVSIEPCLDLSSIELSDAAAEFLSKHDGNLNLPGITKLSNAAAEALYKQKGSLELSGLTELSDTLAE